AVSWKITRRRGRCSVAPCSCIAAGSTAGISPCSTIPAACRRSRPALRARPATTWRSQPGGRGSDSCLSCWAATREACPTPESGPCSPTASTSSASIRPSSKYSVVPLSRDARPSAGRALSHRRTALPLAHRAERRPTSSAVALPRACLFDAYGTLFDVHSVIEAGRAVTSDPQALSNIWRQKQLEYTWLLSLMGRYEDFWGVTERALRFALRRVGATPDDTQISRLMQAYLSLACFPEVKDALARLGGAPLGILSNGSPRMREAAVQSSGLVSSFRHVLSVDSVKVYKPSPRVYELGTKAFGLPASEMLFVSSNAWDIAGAKAFGYRTCWCNRFKAPMELLGVMPDHEVERLDQIPERL